MNFDLLSAIELSASAAIVLAGLALNFGRGPREQLAIAAGLAAWFVAVVVAGATGVLSYDRGLGVPALAVTIVLPVLLLSWLALGNAAGRARVAAASLPAMVCLQAVRVLGISFILLHAAGRLPAPFAPVAGWGDIAVGVIAMPVALLLWRQSDGGRPAAGAWSLLGMADLVTAIALGAASSPGPVRIFFAEPGSGMMTTLPWVIVPCFLVPALFALHIVTVSRLLAARRGGRSGGRVAMA